MVAREACLAAGTGEERDESGVQEFIKEILEINQLIMISSIEKKHQHSTHLDHPTSLPFLKTVTF